MYMEALLIEARKAAGTNPIPFYMMVGHRLVRDVPAQTVLTADMIVPPNDSRLWTLRRELDETFELR